MTSRWILALLLTVAPLSMAAAAPRPMASPTLSAAASARVGEAARALLAARGALGAHDTLRTEQLFLTADGGRIVRLRHLHRGLPVMGAMVVARLDASGQVVDVQGSVRPVTVDAAVPSVTWTQALEAARAAVTEAPVAKEARVGVALAVSQARGGRLVWVLDLVTLRADVAPTVVVDARTGEVLSLRNRALKAGKGRVFATGKATKDARQADGTFDGTGRVDVSLTGLSAAVEGATLSGADVIASNCCPTEGCDPTKPAKTVKGTVQGCEITAVACDERPVAVADANGDFLFEPAREPTKASDPVPGPSEGDAFSEVMAYHDTQSTIDWVRTLDPQFQMGPDARPLHVIANLILPRTPKDTNEFLALGQQCFTNGNKVSILQFERFANAAFVPKGASDQLGQFLPALSHPYDALIMGQGPTADFSYDSDVVSHEVGHAIVASVKGGLSEGQISADEWGVWPAPGSINEGVADAVAAFRANDPHIGEYVGQFELSGEGALRELTSDARCPSVILGEVHQDSQHLSAALWQAREAVAGASETVRRQYDQALLSTIRRFLPTTDFEGAALIMGAEVGLLLGPEAKAKVAAAMADRKVAGCERVVDLVPGQKRSGYQLIQGLDRGIYTPGPVQFRVTVPKGVGSVTLKLKDPSEGLPAFGRPPLSLQAFVKPGEHVKFSYTDTAIRSDATKTVAFKTQFGVSATWSFEPSCEETTWYVALGNGGQQGFGVEELEAVLGAADVSACDTTGGTPDGGADGAGSGGDVPVSPGGCSCGATEGSLGLFAGLLGLVRRRRSQRA